VPCPTPASVETLQKYGIDAKSSPFPTIFEPREWQNTTAALAAPPTGGGTSWGPDKQDLHLMPTSSYQQINSNSTTNDRSNPQQTATATHHQPAAAAGSQSTLPSQPMRLPPVRRHYSKVMASQLQLRSVQPGPPSHTHQSNNSAQLSLLPLSVHQTTIAMTPNRWSLRPGPGLGIMQTPTPIARVCLLSTSVKKHPGLCRIWSHCHAFSYGMPK
jgi:hypothetical protein